MADNIIALTDLLLNKKVENEGQTSAGKLGADEWNSLVRHVWDNKTAVNGTIKGIKYNGGEAEGGQTFTDIDENGFLNMTIADPTGYEFALEVEEPDKFVARGSTCPVKVSVSSKKLDKGDENKKEPASLPASVNIYINDVLVHTGYVWDKFYGDTNSVWYDATKNTLLVFDLSTAVATNLAIGENLIKIQANNRFGKVAETTIVVNTVELGLVVNEFGNINNVFTEDLKPYIIVTPTALRGETVTVHVKVDNTTVAEVEVDAYAQKRISETLFENAGVNIHGIHTISVWASINKTFGETVYPINTAPKSYTYIYGSKNTLPIVMSTISNLTPDVYSTLKVSYTAYKYNSVNTETQENVYVSLHTIDSYDSDGKPIPGNIIGTAVMNTVTFDAVTKSASSYSNISLFPLDGKQASLIGKKLVKLSIGDNDEFVQYTEIEILQSSIELKAASNPRVYLSSAGKSNSQVDKHLWESKGQLLDETPYNITIDFNEQNTGIEFISAGSGWNEDADGNVALHLKKGTYFELPHRVFEENPTYAGDKRGTGKTISFELATRNCIKDDAVVVSCMDDTFGKEVGFEITASAATLKSNKFGLSAKFRENTRVKIDFVIEGAKTTYSYYTVSGEDKTSESDFETGTSDEALCIIYVDGVYQCLELIEDGTSFLQGNKADKLAPYIRFGSEHSDLDIYNIRIYDQALIPAQIVDNYAYDTPKFEDKIAIAARNDIFEDGATIGNKPNINLDRLKKARPELPLFTVTMSIADQIEKLPYDKKNWKNLCSTVWENPMNTNNPINGAVSFSTTDGESASQFRNQGTSSLSYPWPWRNWDWKIKDGKFKYMNGNVEETSSRWCQYFGMSNTENLKKLTFKKDYASSEMCNNAITSEYFSDMALALSNNDDFIGVLSPAQRGLKNKTDYRLTFKAIPCFMLQRFNPDGDKKDNYGTAGKGLEALGMMNLIPNKNECGYLGFMNDYTWESNYSQSWELTDNMPEWFWYKELNGIRNVTTVVNGEEVPSIDNDVAHCYEARYPKDSTLNEKLWNSADEEADFGNVPSDYTQLNDTQLSAIQIEQYDIKEFHNWLVSVNRQISEDYKAENGDYRPLTPDEIGYIWNTEHTKDTPQYRLAKFIAEAPTRLHVDQFCLYYIWREMFWAFDSGFKNLQVYTMGKADNSLDYKQWGCMVRDADTTLGIENTGKDIFPPHLEDIDYYINDTTADANAVSKIKFVYGQARNMYHSNSLRAVTNPLDPTGKKIEAYAVLNGQFGSLWINLRDGFPNRIQQIYRALKQSASANWNTNAAIKRFRDHQEKWCENLYNFGMRQYFGGKDFRRWIKSGLGDKKNSRAAWLERAFYYRDSKYKCLNDDTDCCIIRAFTYETKDALPISNTPAIKKEIINGEVVYKAGSNYTYNEPLRMKTYMPMYFIAGATSQVQDANTNTVIRVTPNDDNENVFDIMPGEGGMNFSHLHTDNNRFFWGNQQLTDVGDWARTIKCNVLQKLSLPKVQVLSLGHEKDRTNGIPYTEISGEVVKELENNELKEMSIANMEQLTVFDITNHRVLSSLTGLDGCKQLQELYMKGTDSLTTLILPESTSLRVLYLGNALTQLNLINKTKINTFVIEGTDKLESLHIENCSPYMSGKVSYDVMTRSIASLERYYTTENNKICILKGINWMDDANVEVAYLERLLNIEAELSGTIKLKNDQQLSNELKMRLINTYGDIDDETNGLHIIYTPNPITEILLPSKLYVHELNSDYQVNFTTNPEDANTFKSADWSLSDETYATINKTTGVIHRNGRLASESDVAYLTVKVNQVFTDNVLEKTIPVYFYERLAKVGDIVFNDGSFSDTEEFGKTPIGICFYIDPLTTSEKEAGIKQSPRRLMFAVNNSSPRVPFAGYAWGAGIGYSYDTNIDGVTITTYVGTSPSLPYKNIGGKNVFNIDSIININESDTSIGMDVGNDNINNMFVDNNYRDQSNTDNDKFKALGINTMLGNIGWDNPQENFEIDGLCFDKKPGVGTHSLNVSKSDYLPIGKINTLNIIRHRNLLLDYCKASYTSNPEGAFARPYTTTNYTEYDILTANTIIGLFNSANGWSYATWDANVGNTWGDTLYYPAASLCFAYEPNVANLAEKFKKYNWFLPSSGELIRLLYYIYHGSPSASISSTAFGDAKVFEKFRNVNFFNFDNYTTDMRFWSSTECTTGGQTVDDIRSALRIPANGIYTKAACMADKYASRSDDKIIPICAF